MRRARRQLAFPVWVLRFLDSDPRLSGVLSAEGIVEIPPDLELRSTLGKLICTEISGGQSEYRERDLTQRLADFGYDGAELRRMLVELELMERNPRTGIYYSLASPA